VKISYDLKIHLESRRQRILHEHWARRQQRFGGSKNFLDFLIFSTTQHFIRIKLFSIHTRDDIFVLNSALPEDFSSGLPRIFFLSPFSLCLYFPFFQSWYFCVFDFLICSFLPPTDGEEGVTGRGGRGSLADTRRVLGRSSMRGGGIRAAVLYCTALYCTEPVGETVQYCIARVSALPGTATCNGGGSPGMSQTPVQTGNEPA